MVEINKNGCPCSFDCCDFPTVFSIEHDCDDDEGKICEECLEFECGNCGRSCQCED
jgi:hypothetical protein